VPGFIHQGFTNIKKYGSDGHLCSMAGLVAGGFG
jgi:hypothetical protein